MSCESGLETDDDFDGVSVTYTAFYHDGRDFFYFEAPGDYYYSTKTFENDREVSTEIDFLLDSGYVLEEAWSITGVFAGRVYASPQLLIRVANNYAIDDSSRFRYRAEPRIGHRANIVHYRITYY